MLKKDVVITGIGVLSPIGTSLDSYWTALMEGRSGIGFVQFPDSENTAKPFGASVPDFNAKDYVKPKKNIKVMSRDIQLGFVAAAHACSDAGLKTEEGDRNVDPDRLGVVFGADLIGLEISELLDAFKAGIKEGKHDFQTWGTAAMENIIPLWMLKYLPNMPACHIAIAHDARGPNNSLTMQRGASLAAIIEAARIIERGDADVVITGGCGNCINPSFLARARVHHLIREGSDPSRFPRPYDADRSGCVLGEGSGALVLESREFAAARGAKIYATLRGFCEGIDPQLHTRTESDAGIRRIIRGALQDAGIEARELDHLNAEGEGTPWNDRLEASAVRAELGDVPVFSLKGYTGNLGSGAGSVEMIASLLALKHELIPATRNCDRIASDCPINVVQHRPQPSSKRFAMKISNSLGGRTFAVVLEKG